MYPLLIVGSKEWDKTGIQTFYFSREWDGEPDYFGPFRDDLQRILREAKNTKSIYEEWLYSADSF